MIGGLFKKKSAGARRQRTVTTADDDEDEGAAAPAPRVSGSTAVEADAAAASDDGLRSGGGGGGGGSGGSAAAVAAKAGTASKAVAASDAAAPPRAASSAASKPQQPIKPSASGLLSFEEETADESPFLKSRKSGSKTKEQRASKANMQAQQLMEEQAAVLERTAPSYTREELMELQQNTFRRQTQAPVPEAGGDVAVTLDGAEVRIPDPVEIALLKAKRERLRQTQGSDFVPLDSSGPPLTGSASLRARHALHGFEGPDMDMYQGADEDRRIAFGDAAALMREARVMRSLVADRLTADDLDAEEQRVLRQQMQARAGPGTAGATALSATAQATAPLGRNQASIIAGAVPLVPTVPTVSIVAIQKRIREAIHRAGEDLSLHRQQLQKVDADLQMAQEAQAKAQRQVAADDARYKFFAELKHYMLDLISCLDEKIPAVAQLHEQLLSAQSRYTAALLERRATTFRAILGDLRLGRRPGATMPPGDGSDDEGDEQQRAELRTATDTALAASSTLFDDVLEEFSEVPAIRRRFEAWLKEYPSEYSKAFVGMCLPTVFAPFVRRELLVWDPLHRSPEDVSLPKMEWYRQLLGYGGEEPAPAAQHVAGTAENDHRKLIPLIVERVVIPHVTTLVAAVWNPFSARQTERMFAAAQTVLAAVDPVNSAALHLRETIAARLASLADSTVLPVEELPSLQSPAYRPALEVLAARALSVVKLVRTSVRLGELIPLPILQHTVCARLVGQTLVPLLTRLPADLLLPLLEALAGALPRAWLDPRLPLLQPLADALTHTGAFLARVSPPTPAPLMERFAAVLRLLGMSVELQRLGMPVR